MSKHFKNIRIIKPIFNVLSSLRIYFELLLNIFKSLKGYFLNLVHIFNHVEIKIWNTYKIKFNKPIFDIFILKYWKLYRLIYFKFQDLVILIVEFRQNLKLYAN